jgi:hypothetical protein
MLNAKNINREFSFLQNQTSKLMGIESPKASYQAKDTDEIESVIVFLKVS